MNLSTAPAIRWQFVCEGLWPTAVAFVGEGPRVAAGNQLGQIFVWDVTGEPPAEGPAILAPKDLQAKNRVPALALVGHDNGVTHLRTTPDGRWLISTSLDHTIRLWDLQAEPGGTQEFVLDTEQRRQEARRKNDEKINDAPGIPLPTLAPAVTLNGHDDWVTSLALSADGTRLITGDASARVVLWDLAERKELRRWSGFSWNWIEALAFTPDGRQVVVSEHRYKRDDFDVPAPAVRLWNVEDGTVAFDYLKALFPRYKPDDVSYDYSQVWRPFIAAGLITAEFSPDGRYLALGQAGETDTGKAHFLDVQTGQLVRDVAAHQYGMTALRFTRDGQHLLTTGRDTCLRISKVEDGQQVHQLGSPRGGQFKDWFSALAVSRDETWLAAADIAGLVHVWQTSEM